MKDEPQNRKLSAKIVIMFIPRQSVIILQWSVQTGETIHEIKSLVM